jgi:predicted  nucleic acid-binding Zn-ribbon protein
MDNIATWQKRLKANEDQIARLTAENKHIRAHIKFLKDVVEPIEGDKVEAPKSVTPNNEDFRDA